MMRILKYVIIDILKNRIVLVYTIMLALFSWSAFSLEDNAAKGLLTVLNIILLTVPLVSVLFSTIYVYNSNEFIELLLSHPVKRSMIWKALFSGLSLSMVIAFLIGTGIPLLLFADTSTALLMMAGGSLLTVIFIAIALLCSMITRDKAKGIGLSIMLWIYFALLFDGLVLFLFFQFAEYPIESVVVGLSALSPIDLCRILILMKLDVSAMMGFTGAVFQKLFGTNWGLMASFSLLAMWSVAPFYLSLRKFKKKDL
ncbi:MAG: ABC transporter permease subunit [Chitinophagaceae bacterium]|nr:ABC transporter permease subunit [Chitinophagaceae bacterium]